MPIYQTNAFQCEVVVLQCTVATNLTSASPIVIWALYPPALWIYSIHSYQRFVLYLCNLLTVDAIRSSDPILYTFLVEVSMVLVFKAGGQYLEAY